MYVFVLKMHFHTLKNGFVLTFLIGCFKMTVCTGCSDWLFLLRNSATDWLGNMVGVDCSLWKWHKHQWLHHNCVDCDIYKHWGTRIIWLVTLPWVRRPLVGASVFWFDSVSRNWLPFLSVTMVGAEFEFSTSTGNEETGLDCWLVSAWGNCWKNEKEERLAKKTWDVPWFSITVKV